jgi:DNA-binding CsgD family transcriptional regulator
MPDMLPDAALALAAAGEDDRALAVARRSVEVAERWGVAGHVGAALRAAGLLEGGRTGLERLERSVQVLADSPFRFERARSLVEYGAALRRDNQRQAAREPLALGMQLADRCGSPVLTERAHDELRAAGARPRQIASSGADALTPSERRVAQLAASGLSNREVAQALFVTTKTVETHLRHAFQKLDVSGRGQLAAALGGDDERPVVTTLVLLGGPLDRHTDLVRRAVTGAGGREVRATGESFLATFDSATAAVRCSRQIASQGPELRSAVHCGEVRAAPGEVHGLAVDVTSGILGLAAAGEVLCSGTVVDLAAGSGLHFSEREAAELGGVPGRWRVFAVASGA